MLRGQGEEKDTPKDSEQKTTRHCGRENQELASALTLGRRAQGRMGHRMACCRLLVEQRMAGLIVCHLEENNFSRVVGGTPVHSAWGMAEGEDVKSARVGFCVQPFGDARQSQASSSLREEQC